MDQILLWHSTWEYYIILHHTLSCCKNKTNCSHWSMAVCCFIGLRGFGAVANWNQNSMRMFLRKILENIANSCRWGNITIEQLYSSIKRFSGTTEEAIYFPSWLPKVSCGAKGLNRFAVSFNSQSLSHNILIYSLKMCFHEIFQTLHWVLDISWANLAPHQQQNNICGNNDN